MTTPFSQIAENGFDLLQSLGLPQSPMEIDHVDTEFRKSAFAAAEPWISKLPEIDCETNQGNVYAVFYLVGTGLTARNTTFVALRETHPAQPLFG
jgi:hypothetical protein